ncbi:hypothetical protein EEO80_22820 [Escherichia albertii]|nr:hypothetical protein [Escherichia albertii]EFF0804022.1 hypothetical protein [Escherichia albertii]
MNFSKLLTITFFLMFVCGMAKSATLATAMLTINATFINPRCDISVPSFYDLGTLTPGRKEHASLSIEWNCTNTPVRTALTASVIRGKLEASGDKLQLIVNGNSNGSLLYFMGGNNDANIIKINGRDSFCSDTVETTEARKCIITPVTEVHNNDTFGVASAILRFEIVYS